MRTVGMIRRDDGRGQSGVRRAWAAEVMRPHVRIRREGRLRVRAHWWWYSEEIVVVGGVRWWGWVRRSRWLVG